MRGASGGVCRGTSVRGGTLWDSADCHCVSVRGGTELTRGSGEIDGAGCTGTPILAGSGGNFGNSPGGWTAPGAVPPTGPEGGHGAGGGGTSTALGGGGLPPQIE